MLFGLETVAMKERHELEPDVAELKMLRFSLGVTRTDRIRNGHIRGGLVIDDSLWPGKASKVKLKEEEEVVLFWGISFFPF